MKKTSTQKTVASTVKKSTTSIGAGLSRKQSRNYKKYLKENNLSSTQKNFSKFKAYENKMAKIKRSEKAISRVNSILAKIEVAEKYRRSISQSVISNYKGAVGFTQKQFDKLANDLDKLNDLDLAKKILPRIKRPDTSQLKWIQKVENLKDLITAVFRDDSDLYFELRDLIIEYNDNKDKLITKKEEGIKNMPIGEYLSLKWNQEKEKKEQAEVDELAELQKYI